MIDVNYNLPKNLALLGWLNDHADQGIFTTDVNLKITGWNHWLEIHSGLLASGMIGRYLLEAYPQLAQRRLERFYNQALSGQVVFLSQRLHGYLLPLPAIAVNTKLPQMFQSVRIAPLMAHGRVLGTITTIEDVSERVVREAELQSKIDELQRTEAMLRSTQARLQHLLSSSPAIIYTSEAKENFTATFVSENITEKLGYTPEEFLSEPNFWLKRVHPDDKPHVFAEFNHLFQVGHHLLEYRFRHRDGSYRWLRDEMKLVHNPQGGVEEIVGAWYDITERKKSEAQVEEQAALLDIATDAIMVWDLENRILFWNKGAEHLYGWTALEAMNQNGYQLLGGKSISSLIEVKKVVLARGEWQGELHQITKNGKEALVASRWTLVRDERGVPKSILAVNTDITEQKKLESQFLRTQRLESIGTLASGIAHDLNNILTPILGAVQLLQIDLPPDKRDLMLQMLESNTKRGADLIKQVLSFARGFEGERGVVQVRHLINEIIAIAKETFPKSIEFFSDIPRDLQLIYGDTTQLHQILMNLSVNARDAMPEGGTLSIKAANVVVSEESARNQIGNVKPGDYVMIQVRDTGTGIPPDVLDRIFEPFFTTKQPGKGTGLGLSTVIGIVKSHGGFICVESEVGEGTEFQVYLPAFEAAEAPLEEDLDMPAGTGQLILLVDDEAPICEITKATLEKYAYRVLTASNGLEAVDLYAQYQDEISVVLLDLMMPARNGPSTIRCLQAIAPDVKIIAVTGLRGHAMTAEAASMGVKAFVSKPYTNQELLKILHTTITT